jgi:hypothetical protein
MPQESLEKQEPARTPQGDPTGKPAPDRVDIGGETIEGPSTDYAGKPTPDHAHAGRDDANTVNDDATRDTEEKGAYSTSDALGTNHPATPPGTLPQARKSHRSEP